MRDYRQPHTVLCIVLVTVLVGGLAIGAVFVGDAQAQQTGPNTNETVPNAARAPVDPVNPGPTPTPTDGAKTGGGLDLNPLPEPWEAMKKMIKGAIADIKKGVAGIVNQFNWLVFSLPAPGNPLQPTTWTSYPWGGDFTARWWNSVWGVYWGLAGIGSIGLAALAIYHHSNRSTITGAQINHHDRTQEAVKAFVAVVLGWVVLAMYIHGMNILTIGVAPSGGEFVSSIGDFSKLGVGIILGALLIALDAVIVLLGVLVLLAQWLLMLFVYAVFPVAVLARVSGSNYARVVSDTIISLLIGLPMLKFIQVLLLRFVFSLPMPASPSTLLTLIVIMVGVFLAFIYLPIEGTKRLLPDAIIAAGGSLKTTDAGMGGVGDKQTAAAVQQHTTQIAQQVRVGPDSAAQRAQPSARTVPSRAAENGHETRPAITGTQTPAVARDTETGHTPVTGPATTPQSAESANGKTPPVTVNTAVETNNTAQAQAEASASSTSSDSNKNTQTRRPLGIPSTTRPLRRAKRKIEQRRRNNSDD